MWPGDSEVVSQDNCIKQGAQDNTEAWGGRQQAWAAGYWWRTSPEPEPGPRGLQRGRSQGLALLRQKGPGKQAPAWVVGAAGWLPTPWELRACL